MSNLPLRGFTVGVLVFAILFDLHEKLLEIHRYCDSKHCFADAEGTIKLFLNTLVIDGKSLSLECCLETKNAS